MIRVLLAAIAQVSATGADVLSPARVAPITPPDPGEDGWFLGGTANARPTQGRVGGGQQLTGPVKRDLLRTLTIPATHGVRRYYESVGGIQGGLLKALWLTPCRSQERFPQSSRLSNVVSGGLSGRFSDPYWKIVSRIPLN